MKNDTINKEDKEPKKEDDKKQEEQKSFVNLDIDQRIKSEFTSIYGRNMYYFQRPYTRQQSIVALNEMNDFFIQNSDIIDYINNLDINSINPIDRMIVEQMKKILKDIEDYPDILSSKNKIR